MPRRRWTYAALAAVFLTLAPSAGAMGSPSVAALQVALHARGLYVATIDGVKGAATERAIRALQRKAGLPVDGVIGPKTRAALGRFGRPRIGSRPLDEGKVGWDVAALQYALAWHGFPSGTLDGHFGGHTAAAVRKFQRWSRLEVDGIAGPAVFAALRSAPPSSPIALSLPLDTPSTDGFGPRGVRFHTGLDFPAPSGTPVLSAGSGRVRFAGWYPGYGYLVSVAHGSGVRTLYAHLSKLAVRLGDTIERGERVGLVGSTGASTGPHLHFEVRVRGAAVDPLTALR
jgi:murein DD-endopeptidase MepM/ murein hydrolase activator NlpD